LQDSSDEAKPCLDRGEVVRRARRVVCHRAEKSLGVKSVAGLRLPP
jgi:hypothetical protein